jgi:ParB family chromosome partitioning protein
MAASERQVPPLHVMCPSMKASPSSIRSLLFRAQNDERHKAASFKTQGILAPLLVRELEESKYEVVAGARRLRAAKLAELKKLPVRVVKLTDAEAIETQCVENLQREDIHPLEEALGFKSLLELGEPAYTIATIASRAGKSEAYVYGRIRLADLIPQVAEAFLKDQITIGHALLIAKLPASQQQEAFVGCFSGLVDKRRQQPSPDSSARVGSVD